MAQLLEELAGDADDLVDGLHHVDRNADGPGLVRDGTGDGLANPPGGIGGELVSLGIVKLLHRLDQAQVPLLNQIQEEHPPAHVAFGNGDHQTEIGLRQTLLGPLPRLDQLFHLPPGLRVQGHTLGLHLLQLALGLLAGDHGLGQGHLLLTGEQVHLADLL